MALSPRHLLLITRLIAGATALFGARSLRRPAWMLHDVLWLYPTLCRNSTLHGPVVTRFETNEREVWLTLDDGPDPENTPALLDLLREHQARATFFVVGKKVDEQRPLVRRIRAEGHELANHTHSHPAALWWALPRWIVGREIRRCDLSLRAATGEAPRYFRSPVGMNSTAIHPATANAGLRVIGWSADGTDGCGGVPTQIVRSILRDLRPGAIILLHEAGHPRHRVQTLKLLLETLQSRGYRCVLPPPEALRS